MLRKKATHVQFGQTVKPGEIFESYTEMAAGFSEPAEAAVHPHVGI